MPQIQFVFFCTPSATDGKRDVGKFCHEQMGFAQTVWNPKEPFVPPDPGGPVPFQWDGDLKPVADKANDYKLIEIYRDRCPKALKLIRGNWTQNAGPLIPVFVCLAAWDQARDAGDKPAPGNLNGFTVTKRGVPWFTGDRAILLFISTARTGTLAHELSHWFGYTHGDLKEDAGNIGQDGGSGAHILRDQHHSMFRWANDATFRARL